MIFTANYTMEVVGKKIAMAPRTSQASRARQVFASQGLIARPRSAKEAALTELGRPVSPQSVGLGRRRKTRRGKKNRRVTRRKL